MFIKDITIHNFKSIKQLYLDFETLNGLYEIRGVVGAGKTTISEAILFGLFGSIKNKNNKELIRWGEKQCNIELNIISKNQELNIKRSIKGGSSTLDVLLNGESIIFTNKRDAQKQLETDYYDTSKLVIETLFIISFNNFKSISNFNSRELKDFVDNVFNLYIITDYTNACKNKIKLLQNDEIAINANISSLNNQIETFNNLKNNVTVSEEEYENTKNKYKETSEKLNKYKKAKEQKLYKIQSEITEVKSQGAIQDHKIKELTKNIEFIKKEFCPTCGAKIDASKLQEYLDEKAALEKSLAEYKEKYNKLQKENQDIQFKAATAINDLEIEVKELNNIIIKFDNHKKQVKTYEETIENIKNNLKKYKDNQKILSKDILQYSELFDLLNVNVRQTFFKSVIPLINSNIANYCYKLALPYTIRFTDDFTCEISSNICEDISITSLSTGQIKTVDMIIILSVLKILLNNFNMNLIFLDELFSNLDDESRDMMCSLLKDEITDSKTMFIISHSPLPEDKIDGKILVERSLKDNESKFIIL